MVEKNAEVAPKGNNIPVFVARVERQIRGRETSPRFDRNLERCIPSRERSAVGGNIQQVGADRLGCVGTAGARLFSSGGVVDLGGLLGRRLCRLLNRRQGGLLNRRQGGLLD